ncbi:conserved hypothetical protein [Roseibium sp. TrichSKD4]|uniref:hypothetical protein n=1 Tax=Roseibium sp. TrichSKD4 TaxID=744980 RepID=UPI0001E56F0A|nr:hypothetical protein [Roseibium sp. TrichSKD4]EFO32052.1 conserved hypothetical protein [Roseibium sp. TrichSKD4]
MFEHHASLQDFRPFFLGLTAGTMMVAAFFTFADIDAYRSGFNELQFKTEQTLLSDMLVGAVLSTNGQEVAQ